MAQVYATKGNLIKLKKSLELAQRGYELLDRKNNILLRELMSHVDEANHIQSGINKTYAEAYAALQRANITLGIVDDAAEAVPIDNSLTVDFKSMMGAELPVVSVAAPKPQNYYGYEQTNSFLDEAYAKFSEVKQLTVRLAEVENSVYRLAAAIKKTQKRANALDNIVIPRFEQQIKEITESLSEKEREEFSRMKVIKKNK